MNVHLVWRSSQGRLEKMLPCDSIMESFPFVGYQARYGPWLKCEIREMRRLIFLHGESFGVIHPEVNYVDLLNSSRREAVAHFVESHRPTVALGQLFCWIPAERQTTERDVELLRQFSMWYDWEAREE